MGDYKALELAYVVPDVEAKAIDALIDELRQQQAITEKSEEPAEEGNRVFYQVSADRAEVKEGEEANLILDRFNSAIIEAEGEEQNQWPFPGFSRNLAGMSVDEEKDVIYTYPEDHEDEELQEVEAVFHIVITNVQKVTLPELDDEFAKSASDFDTIEELRADIEENLKGQKEQEYDSEYNNLVIETMVEQSTIKYPPQMVESEKKEMISNLDYRLSQQGINHELYLQIRGISEEEFSEEMEPLAENRLKSGLVLAEVAKVENLEVDQQLLAAEAGHTMNVITRGMTPKDIKKLRKSAYLQGLMNSITANMMTQQSTAYLRAIARGEPLPGAESNEPETEEGEEASDTEVTLEAEAVPEETIEKEASIPEAEETPEDDEPASKEKSAEEETESE